MYRLPDNFEHPVVGLVETLFKETVVHDQGSQLSLEKSVTPIEFLDHYESILYCLQRSRLKIIENEKVLFHAVGIHLLEDDPDDVFLVAKMVIKIAWANAGGSGDMVGRDGLGALLVCRTFLNRVSRKIFEEFPHVKKRYWGRHFWGRGYFCVTSGELTKEMIQEYLAHHFEKDPNDRFDIE